MQLRTPLLFLFGAVSLLPAGVLVDTSTYGRLNGATATSTIVGAPTLGAIGDINDPAGPFVFPRGVGLDGTVALIINTNVGSFLCSGAMIGPSAVLAAAHCFTDSSGNKIANDVSVIAFPNGTTTSATLAAPGSEIYIPSAYDGAVISDYDIAIVRLPSSFGAGVDIYDTFGAADIVTTAPFTMVGFGRRGDGATGATLSSGARRRGFNQFDFFNSAAVLVSDFDNGLTANDASCFAVGVCGLGLGNFEASTASGDSGGPVFLNGKIVAVSSFGARFGAVDIDGTLNASFGEFNGFVYTGFHEAWIDSILAIPEPGSWLFSFAGLSAALLLRWREIRKNR
jgi:hypothetical protein